MRYLEFLSGAHKALHPSSYLEIGIRSGTSLALSRTKSVGIDPEYAIKAQLRCNVRLYRQTSDEYFARAKPLAPFGGRPIDLAFIDGMHLFEYSLRDFINVERHAHWSSVIVFDDMFPRNADEAARNRHTKSWTGDVYKMIPVLQKYRPDLLCLKINTQPTGLLMILGADSGNDTLHRHYDEIVRNFVIPDPQDVPQEIIAREGALDPTAVLEAPFWQVLQEGRTSELGRAAGLELLSAALGGNGSIPPSSEVSAQSSEAEAASRGWLRTRLTSLRSRGAGKVSR